MLIEIIVSQTHAFFMLQDSQPTEYRRDPRFDLRSQFTVRRVGINIAVVIGFYAYITFNPCHVATWFIYSPTLLVLAAGLWWSDQDLRLILTTLVLVTLGVILVPDSTGDGPNLKPAIASFVASIASYAVHRFRFIL
ncbi:hypothetical protein N9N28_15060 [Rubripirellula amarantea]|nr:hypothetical protein [Rubripirellula amarantea]